MPPTVPPDGPRGAHLVVVGEAPGDEEVREGRPFVGPSGRFLTECLEKVGLSRDACYVTNVLKEQPQPHAATMTARNEFASLYDDKARRVPSTRLRDALTALEVELRGLTPTVIVPLGNEALRAVTGCLGISNWRGSILEAPWGAKVIPTYHPAAVLRQWGYQPLFMADWRRIVEQLAYPEIRRLACRTHTLQHLDDVGGTLLRFAQQPDLPVSFDIETAAQQVLCIGFAQGPTDAYTIPLWSTARGSLWSMEEELNVWAELQALFRACKTVGHNVHYDLTYLKAMEVEAHRLHMDTMAAYHTLYLELPKGLDTLTSLYTDIPYYKWMGSARATKQAFVTPPAWDEDLFWRYNGLDALATWRCMGELEKELLEG